MSSGLDPGTWYPRERHPELGPWGQGRDSSSLPPTLSCPGGADPAALPPGTWTLGWPAWSLSELRGRHCPGRPRRGSRGRPLEVVAFNACRHTRLGCTGCQHAGHLCWTRCSLLVAEGRSESLRAVTATREAGKSRWGPLPRARATRAQGGRPPRSRALPALPVDGALWRGQGLHPSLLGLLPSRRPLQQRGLGPWRVWDSDAVRCWGCGGRCSSRSECTCFSGWIGLEPAPHLDTWGPPASLAFPRSQWDGGHGEARLGGGRLSCPPALAGSSQQPTPPVRRPGAESRGGQGCGPAQSRVPAGAHPTSREEREPSAFRTPGLHLPGVSEAGRGSGRGGRGGAGPAPTGPGCRGAGSPPASL